MYNYCSVIWYRHYKYSPIITILCAFFFLTAMKSSKSMEEKREKYLVDPIIYKNQIQENIKKYSQEAKKFFATQKELCYQKNNLELLLLFTRYKEYSQAQLEIIDSIKDKPQTQQLVLALKKTPQIDCLKKERQNPLQ